MVQSPLAVELRTVSTSYHTDPTQLRQVKPILATLPAEGWTRLSAGDRAQGPRWDDWRRLPLAEPLEPGWRRWWLGRRSLSELTELAASVILAPRDTPLEAGVRVAGTRWTMERGVEAAKREVGLDHYEVWSWTGWYRHITLARWALAPLAALRAGAIVGERLTKSPRLSQEPSRVAAFKAQRGLRSP
jgi:hypothetical protein